MATSIVYGLNDFIRLIPTRLLNIPFRKVAGILSLNGKRDQQAMNMIIINIITYLIQIENIFILWLQLAVIFNYTPHAHSIYGIHIFFFFAFYIWCVFSLSLSLFILILLKLLIMILYIFLFPEQITAFFIFLSLLVQTNSFHFI